jgi:hypothetical protein
MLNELSTPAIPYDQDERFEGLDVLISLLEAKWQHDKETSADNDPFVL